MLDVGGGAARVVLRRRHLRTFGCFQKAVVEGSLVELWISADWLVLIDPERGYHSPS